MVMIWILWFTKLLEKHWDKSNKRNNNVRGEWCSYLKQSVGDHAHFVKAQYTRSLELLFSLSDATIKPFITEY